MPGSVLLSHGISHTIIGAEQFHFRVRDGIGWFPLAIAARQIGYVCRLFLFMKVTWFFSRGTSINKRHTKIREVKAGIWVMPALSVFQMGYPTEQTTWVLYGQALGQLVLVSFMC